MKRITAYLSAVLFLFIFTSNANAQDPIQIVQDGVLIEDNAEVIGEPWQQVDGYLQQQGTNQYLWAKPVIGPGDFHVTAVLKMQDMFDENDRGAAASFAINDMLQSDGANGSNFGFVGGSGELFLEGNFVSSFTNLGETPISDDQEITLEFIR
ncbi:hypothetical protein K8I31_17660, partial [bacterium]|nr:hypothetical protein [bacterium]